MNRYCRSWLLVAAVALVATPVNAAELDKFLPDDTQVIATINIRQIIDSGLAKKFELGKELENLMGQNDEAIKVLKSLGLDPLKDINRITAAHSGKEDEKKGLTCIR